jgi:nitroreductase
MEFKDAMEKRRAVNFFDSTRDISDAQIQQIIETAALAPSGFNLQPWKVIVVKEKHQKENLRKVAMNQPKITEAPAVLIILSDTKGWEKGNEGFEKNFEESVKEGTLKKEQYDWFVKAAQSLYGATPERQLAFACKNAGFFAMSLMLAAKDAGFDSHPMDGFDMDGVRDLFHIPEQFWIVLLLALGYFDENKTLIPAKWRKRYEDIIVSFHETPGGS